MTTDNSVALLLNAISPPARRGWWMAHVETESGDREVFFYLSFHVHPDDASKTETLLRGAIAQDPGHIKWWLSQSQPGRFFLCPEGLRDRVREPPQVKVYTNKELQVARAAYLAIPSLVEFLNVAQRSAP